MITIRIQYSLNKSINTNYDNKPKRELDVLVMKGNKDWILCLQ
jgi:hypothetical protein